MAASLKYSLHQYADDNELQRLGVWEVDIQDKSKYWVIYIHGGAWRDPRIGHETFTPIIDHMLSSAFNDGRSRRPGIAAFASLDYRLSPHPELPQDPAETPPRRLRNALHPDHLDDVRAALAYLQRRYEHPLVGGNYVLVGHSAGACLALQLLHSPGDVVLPKAIVGFEGVYDFTGLNARMGGGYAGFLSGAFGDPEGWDEVAPMTLSGSYGESWGGREGKGKGKGEGKILALGWSPDDDLIDEPEIDGMVARLERDGIETKVFKDLRGKHDEIWEDGSGVARMVLAALNNIGDT